MDYHAAMQPTLINFVRPYPHSSCTARSTKYRWRQRWHQASRCLTTWATFHQDHLITLLLPSPLNRSSDQWACLALQQACRAEAPKAQRGRASAATASSSEAPPLPAAPSSSSTSSSSAASDEEAEAQAEAALLEEIEREDREAAEALAGRPVVRDLRPPPAPRLAPDEQRLRLAQLMGRPLRRTYFAPGQRHDDAAAPGQAEHTSSSNSSSNGSSRQAHDGKAVVLLAEDLRPRREPPPLPKLPPRRIAAASQAWHHSHAKRLAVRAVLPVQEQCHHMSNRCLPAALINWQWAHHFSEATEMAVALAT